MGNGEMNFIGKQIPDGGTEQKKGSWFRGLE